MGRDAEAGFTLIEVLIGAAIAALLTWMLVAAANRTVAAASELGTQLDARSAALHLVERLTSETASAQQLSVPANDVLGENNDDGHELDVASEDGSHRSYAWAYRYDATTHMVTRYTIAAGSAPAAGETFAPIDAFAASLVDAAAIASTSSLAYDPLFAHSTVMGYAGNQLVELTIAARGITRRIALAPPAAPTAFTVIISYTPSPAPLQTATPAPLTLSP